MSTEAALSVLLKPLVDGRARPVIFAQPGTTPIWPAIRYTIIDTVPVQTRCGDGDNTKSQHRWQIDYVDKTLDGVVAGLLAVMAAMKSFGVTARLDFIGPAEYDDETKTYRRTLDYLINGTP